MRRILQATGCEVIHLGHNRSVEEIVDCALQEDAHGIAISSYQGGHVEYFKYMIDLLRERGGGAHQGVRRRRRRDRARRDRGAARLRRRRASSRREDGRALGLQGMINEIVARLRRRPVAATCPVGATRCRGARASSGTHALARLITALESGRVCAPRCATQLHAAAAKAEGRRCSASPAPAAPARARSPTSSCAASASTRTTRCGSRSSRSIRRAARPAARCSATASA